MFASDVFENNKRIARNTALLYFRMLLTMTVSLFTVRIVLNTLGAIDYGIYNVVAGIVMMFSFMSNTMASASQRFFAFELGRNDIAQLKKTFSLTISIYGLIAIIVLVLAESVGIWFLNTQMVIPAERLNAANWVYQFAIFSFMITIITIPYNAVIIAHEDMKIYAYISIIEVVLKLVIVYVLVYFSFDKLKLYAVLMFFVTCIITFIYKFVCKRRYVESRFKFYWDKELFNILLSYSGWTLFGASAAIFKNQGINILLNIFFGPIVNAARAIAYQVNSAVNQFVLNFFTAVRPQIIKYYASNEKDKMLKLIYQSSKFSYFLLFILSMPILLETNYILTLWLKETPQYVVVFTRLIIICALIDSLSYPLITAAQATGRIKKYQIIVGGTLLLNLPITFIFIKLGFLPQVAFYIAIAISIITLFFRLFLLKEMVGLSIKKYLGRVILVVMGASIIAYIIPLIIYINMNEWLLRFLVVGIVGLLTSLLAIYNIGLTKKEQQFLLQIIYSRVINKLNPYRRR